MRVELLFEPPTPSSGGGHTISHEIVRSLLSICEPCRHEFIIINQPVTDWLPSKLPSHFTRITVKKTLRERIYGKSVYLWRRWSKAGWPDWPLQTSLKKSLSEYQVDCALSLIPGVFSRVLPNIITVWDLEHRRKPYFPEVSASGEWDRREDYNRWLFPRALHLIIGTETGKQQIQALYGVDPSCISVIPFPAPRSASEYSLAQTIHSGKLPDGVSGEFIFYPAQYWPHKNHIHLLQAIKILREKYGWDGMLVCCGSDKGNLGYIKESAARLGVGDYIRLLGFVSNNELTALYRHALALSFVSYFGPDNLPPLEAFVLGCPVIASAVEGVEETVGDAALLVNPDEPHDIANAVNLLRADSAYRTELIERGKAQVQLRVAEGSYADKVIQLLDGLEKRFECWR